MAMHAALKGETTIFLAAHLSMKTHCCSSNHKSTEYFPRMLGGSMIR